MTTNGRMRPISEILAEVERDKQRERDEAHRAHCERLEAELARVNAALAKLTQPPPLLRSKMSAKAKSDFIQARKAEGLSGTEAVARYFELPWE